MGSCDPVVAGIIVGTGQLAVQFRLTSQRRKARPGAQIRLSRVFRVAARHHRVGPMQHPWALLAQLGRHVTGTSVVIGDDGGSAEERRLGRSFDVLSLDGAVGGADQPVRQHFALALHGDVAALFGDVSANLLQRQSTLVADVNTQRFAVRLHPRRRVDCIAEEAIAWHCKAHHSGYDWSCPDQ